jgi:putative two-component system response regulator
MMIQNKSARILIVDDEPANLKLLDKMLREDGYQNLVLTADPREVVNAYLAAYTDLILLDLNMPHMDGFEVMRQLAELGDPLLPPVVVLTAQAPNEVMLCAFSSGARDFIRKPFDRFELLARVRNLLDAQFAHRLVYEQKTVMEEMVQERTRALRDSRLQIVRRLGRAAEYRDNETGAHLQRMSHVAALLARSIGWSDAECELILNASPMHDIGKIGISDLILLKPGRLSPEERSIMETHPEIGADILAESGNELLEMAHQIALTHHEKWDGTGYPKGLAGEDIPMVGRICAIADVFDALTAERPYKKAWPIDKAITFMRDNAGKHFDPNLIDHFLNVLPQVFEIQEHFLDQPDRSPSFNMAMALS